MHPAIIIGLVVLSYLSVTRMPGAARDREYEVPKIESRSGTENDPERVTEETTEGPVESRTVELPEPTVLSGNNEGNFSRGRDRAAEAFDNRLDRELEKEFEKDEKRLEKAEKEQDRQLERAEKDLERQFKETEKQLAEIDKKLEKQLQETLKDLDDDRSGSNRRGGGRDDD